MTAVAASWRAALRAAPGFLVLARGAPARLRLPADRPLLSRRVHRSRSALLLWLLVRSALAGASRALVPRMIPAVVVFAYLGVVLVHRHLRVPRVRAPADAEDYLPRRPLARPGRVPAVAVRRQHDGVLHPRRLGPRLRQRHRHLRADGVLVGAGHPAVPVRRSARGCGRSASGTAS